MVEAQLCLVAITMALSGCATSALSDTNVVGQFTTSQDTQAVSTCIASTIGRADPVRQGSNDHFVVLRVDNRSATDVRYDIKKTGNGLTMVQVWSRVGVTQALPPAQACL